MKKLTTTKLILFATLIFCGILEIAIIIAWIFFDKCDAASLAGVVAAPASVIIGFYEWKAKAENLAKYSNSPVSTDEDVANASLNNSVCEE